MSEQKEMKNMKNAAEAQTAGQNTTETIVKQTETADAANRIMQLNSRQMLLPSRL